jgi:hypothetical protein
MQSASQPAGPAAAAQRIAATGRGSYKRVSLLAAGRISETTSTARLMLGAAAPEMSAMSGLRGQSDMQTLIISGSRRRLIAQATPCTLRRKLSVHF